MIKIRSKTKRAKRVLIATGGLCSSLSLLTALPQAQELAAGGDGGWFIRSWGSFSSLSDTNGTVRGFMQVPNGDGVEISTSGGFSAGAGVGYRYGPRLGVEVAWEYRSNDSETALDSGLVFDGGNYASNTIFLNGYWYLQPRGRWQPYLGAGLAWLQEIDIDLEGNGPEQSFSSDGDVGLQVFAGTEYRFADNWAAHGELRYGAISGIDLDGENTSGTLSGLDYEPLSLQFGITYSF